MELKIYVISLRNSKRRDFQSKQLKNLGYAFNYIDAISAACIKRNEFENVSGDWQRPMKKSEVACYLSHQSAWKRVIQNNSPALILEDDALILSDIKKLLLKCENLKGFDLINLENRGRKKFVSRFANAFMDEYSLYRLYLDTTGAAGYILWPSGAKKILSCEKSKGFALADAQIFNCRKLKSFQVEPSPIIQLDMARHYNIDCHFDSGLSKSSVSSNLRYERDWVFIVRRIWSQLILGIYRLIISIYSTKRNISIPTKKNF